MFKLKSVELKLKLDTAKDIIIIKVITRNNIGKQSLTKKNSCKWHLRKIYFEGELVNNISCAGKTWITEAFGFKNNMLNLFVMDWMELYDL